MLLHDHIARPAVARRTALTDPLGRAHTYLRISVTDRCNLRCFYCMPPQGIALRPRAELLTFDEIVRVAHLCTALGVTKIRVTGGEPLVRRDVPELVARLARLPGVRAVGLTTNGVHLREQLGALQAAGLRHLNISLDTLRPERFAKIARRTGHAEVLAGLAAALAAGFATVKLNMVVIGGVNDDELGDFAELARAQPLQVRFIEYMPFKANQWNRGTFVPYRAMLAALQRRHPLTPLPPADAATVARVFAVPGFVGTLGFITSMSEHFCGACNRIRLTADGSLKSCLFHPAETNLRAALRGGAADREILAQIRHAVAHKAPHHAPAEELVAADNRCMTQIGG